MDLSLCWAADGDPNAVFDALKSFPSGHAQISSFAASYIMVNFIASYTVSNSHYQVYMSIKLPTTQSFLLQPWIQFILVSLTMFSSISRVQDNRHHVWDVVAGVALGAFIGVATALGLKPPVTNIDVKPTKRTSTVQLISPSLNNV